MPAALCHPCQVDCNLVCLLCLTIRLPADFHSRRSHTLSSASPASRATGKETYSSSFCSSSMRNGFLVAVAPCARGAEPLLFVWQRAPGALRQIQHGLRAVLDLSRQQHPVLLLQPLDNLEVSIPTSNVDGQPARLGRGHQRHPVLLRQPLDQCPSPRAQCMGCEPSLALAVSDTP